MVHYLSSILKITIVLILLPIGGALYSQNNLVHVTFLDKNVLRISNLHRYYDQVSNRSFNLSQLIVLSDKSSGEVLEAFLIGPGRYHFRTDTQFSRSMIKDIQVTSYYNEYTLYKDLQIIQAEIEQRNFWNLLVGMVDELFLDGTFGLLKNLYEGNLGQILLKKGIAFNAAKTGSLFGINEAYSKKFSNVLFRAVATTLKSQDLKRAHPLQYRKIELVNNLASNPTYNNGLAVDLSAVSDNLFVLTGLPLVTAQANYTWGRNVFKSKASPNTDWSDEAYSFRGSIALTPEFLALKFRKKPTARSQVWARLYLTGFYEDLSFPFLNQVFVDEAFLANGSSPGFYAVPAGASLVKYTQGGLGLGLTFLSPVKKTNFTIEGGMVRSEAAISFSSSDPGEGYSLSNEQFEIINNDGYHPYWGLDIGLPIIRALPYLQLHGTLRFVYNNPAFQEGTAVYLNDSGQAVSLGERVTTLHVGLSWGL